MARYEHTGGAAVTTLTAPITDVAMTFTVDDATGYPTGVVGPFWVVLGAATANEEKVLCATRAGDVFTVASGGRGGDGTVAVPHNAAEQVRHIFTATEADDANEHIESSVAHGRSSALVGVNDVQTLTGKTISGATNNITGLAQSSVTGLVDRLTVPHVKAFKATPSSVAPSVEGTPGTLTTEFASGITTPPGYHSSNRQVTKAGLYLITYRLRLTVTSIGDTIGDFRLYLGLNPPELPVTALGTIVAQTEHHNFLQFQAQEVAGGKGPVTFNGSGVGTLTHGLGWVPAALIPNPELNTSSILVTLDAAPGSNTVALRAWNVVTGTPYSGPISNVHWIAIRDTSESVLGGTVELVETLRLDENDIIGFRMRNNSTTQTVEISGGSGVDEALSTATMTWLAP